MKPQKSKFSLTSSVAYLNCAYMSPILKKVEKAGMEAIRFKRNPFSISTDDFFSGPDAVRKEFGKLIEAQPSRIAIIPSVSYGLANVTNNIKLNAGDRIVVAYEQFPSNYYPWQRVAADRKATITVVEPPRDSAARGKVWNERLLEAIKPGVKVVALGHVHWADGTRFDLKAIRKRTRDVGALLIIDGTQSVGALPFSVKEFEPDALICAGYKWLMGPYGIGMAYYGEAFDGGTPIEENWINRFNSQNFAALVNYQEGYQPGAMRYDVGERSNFILVPMMLEALRQVNEWQPQRIQQHCKSISGQAVKKLKQAGYWIEEDEFRGQHLFGIRLPESKSLDAIKATLLKKKISVSYRGTSIRVSPHLYNSKKEFDKLTHALS